MSLESLTDTIRSMLKGDATLDGTVKFVLPDEGVIFLDATSMPGTVSNDDRDADCTITIEAEDFEALLSGELDGTMAFMTGKLKVAGNMGIAMQLQSVI
ncbi:MAG: SCP2 sterol-binding domain-containing protein [Alphaproteobacteria bacterium]|nr:SCP2 sterol-binding domain-containing protein [Alphaproteobacteria bacterium]